eukprot:UN08125
MELRDRNGGVTPNLNINGGNSNSNNGVIIDAGETPGAAAVGKDTTEVLQRIHYLHNPDELPLGWKGHYYTLPIKLYITQHLQSLSNTKQEFASSCRCYNK